MPAFKYLLTVLACCIVLLVANRVSAQEFLSLDEAIDRALERNYDVRMARNTADIAASNQTLGNAGFLPSLQLNAGGNAAVTDTRQTFVGSDPRELDNASSTSANASAQAQWVLFDGLSRFTTHDRLGAERRQEEYYADRTEQQVIADVVTGYYDTVQQRQQLVVRREALDISRQRLEIARSRYDLGSASELEVRRAEVAVNTDSAAVMRQERTLQSTKEELGRLLARSEPPSSFTVADTIVVDTTLRADYLMQSSRRQNPLLEQAREQETIADLTRQEITAERYPTIRLNTGYTFTNLTSESGFMERNRSFEFAYGFTVSYDLFDGLNRRRRINNAEIRMRNARLAIEDVSNELRTDLRNQYEQYTSSLRLLALERSNLGAARENVEVALEQFELGTITSVELRDVQEALVTAEARIISAQFEAKQAEVELLRLAGQLPSGLPE
jgi:outer membrane protein TolC